MHCGILNTPSGAAGVDVGDATLTLCLDGAVITAVLESSLMSGTVALELSTATTRPSCVPAAGSR